MDFLQDDGRSPQWHAAAAIFLRNESAQKSGISERLDELAGISLTLFEFTPITAGEIRADSTNAFTDLLIVITTGDGYIVCCLLHVSLLLFNNP